MKTALIALFLLLTIASGAAYAQRRMPSGSYYEYLIKKLFMFMKYGMNECMLTHVNMWACPFLTFSFQTFSKKY
ncbi:hypothetical protein CAEBREN_11176 [Caenorhabditis brenneri]|uniref:Uncharacterized protein n=1 Tax=Caenorhabditis brenneri TaxID=135651 RepID=G0P6L7_CAEBE|nr:hypothetical protein CAEBREN_11176 [Caenorhabditis brenneri]